MAASTSVSNAGRDHFEMVFPTLSEKLNLKPFFASIAPQLDMIEERIRLQAREFDSGISGYIDYACMTRGKRIRPALSILIAKATGGLNQGHLDLAVVIELIHLATLVHDDIMDNASHRRGQPTAYAKWGSELSVLLGDCLFCQALKLCANFPTTEVSRKIADAASEVCSGEILQTQRRFDLKLPIPDYFKMIEMKTAALFRVSTELSAILNNAPAEQVQACRIYGNNLGIAYQIYDDCLDLVGTETAAEKNVGSDLAKGKLTLPVLHLLQQLEGAEREAVSEIILHGSEEDRLKLLSLAIERGGLKQAVRKIQNYLSEATASLRVLPDSEYRQSLHSIAEELSHYIVRLSQ